jgi:hypothetical protein
VPFVVVTFTLLFGAAVAITVFTSAEILLSDATGSALAGGVAGGFSAVAVSGAAGAGAAGAAAAGASLAGAAGGFAGGLGLLLATMLSDALSLERLRAARRSAAVFFLDGLAWSEEDVAVSFCATLGAGAAAGGAARAAARAAAASSTGGEAGAAGADVAAVASGGGGAVGGATGAAGVALATCIACSLCDTYRYSPPPKSAARAMPTTILGAGDGDDAFISKHSFVTGDTHVLHLALRDTCQRNGALRFT